MITFPKNSFISANYLRRDCRKIGLTLAVAFIGLCRAEPLENTVEANESSTLHQRVYLEEDLKHRRDLRQQLEKENKENHTEMSPEEVGKIIDLNSHLRKLHHALKEAPAPPSSKWPTPHFKLLLPEQIATEKVASLPHQQAYQSQHYRIDSNAGLTLEEARQILWSFEIIYHIAAALPLDIKKAQLPEKGPYRHRIVVTDTKERYLREGGSKGSKGIYLNHLDSVLLTAEDAGLYLDKENKRHYSRPHATSALPYLAAQQLFRYEYLTDRHTYWYTQGLSLYLEAIYWMYENYNEAGINEGIKRFISAQTKQYGNALNLEKKFMWPQELTKAPSHSFFEQIEAHQHAKAQYQYECLLTLTYLLHSGSDDPRSPLQNYLQAIQKGEQAKESFRHLIKESSSKNLALEVSTYWSQYGLKFSYD